MAETYAPEYEKILQEEGLDAKSLPTDIKKSINGFKMLLAKYHANPTDGMLAGVETADVKICEAIENYIEAEAQKASDKKAAEKAEAEKKEQEKIAAEKAEAERLEAEKKEQEKIAAEKAEQERVAAEKKSAEEKEQQRISAEKEASKPENRIKAKLNDKGEISEKDLKEILGKLNAWDAEERVGSLHLKKIFPTDRYRLVK